MPDVPLRKADKIDCDSTSVSLTFTHLPEDISRDKSKNKKSLFLLIEIKGQRIQSYRLQTLFTLWLMDFMSFEIWKFVSTLSTQLTSYATETNPM